MTRRPVALVTGAGRGIGRACAVALARRGFDLVLNERGPEVDLSTSVEAVSAQSARAAGVVGDIAAIDGHGRLLDAAWTAFGRLDCLVNNAGVSVMARGDLLDVAADSFDRCVGVNTRGTFFLTQAFARRLLAENDTQAGHRSVVFITSSNAEAVTIERGEYCISKAAASMAAQLFAVRLAPEGIGVYEVRPGIIRTEMTEPSAAKYDAFFAAGNAPMPRWGVPQEVGVVVATMASGDLPYTVGLTARVDGGFTIPRL